LTQRLASWNANTLLASSSMLALVQESVPSLATLEVSPSTQLWSSERQPPSLGSASCASDGVVDTAGGIGERTEVIARMIFLHHHNDVLRILQGGVSLVR
jgi:hypothetical protein